MKKTIIFLLFSLSLFSASAKIWSVRATLNGANEVPSNGATGTGTLLGTFDDVSVVLNYTLLYSGMTGSLTGAHFHSGVTGANGPVTNPIGSVNSPYKGLATFSATNIPILLAGNIYINLHTTLFPGGEIRGQLIATELEVFTSSNMSDFYGIGGYSYTEGDFPLATSLGSPYVRSGPLPNNDFTFVATSPTGLFGFQNKLTTNSSNQPITLTFKGNNVRKMRAFVRPENTSGVPQNSAFITATATTNLGNTASITNFNSVINVSVGFRVLNENEYITQVVFSAPSNSLLFTTLDNIMIGDDVAQNVSLNFDGVKDYVTLPSSVGNFASNATFTVSCWVKPATLQSDLANTDVDILEKWDQSESAYPFVIRYLNENIANGANVGKIVAARYNGIANPSIMSSVSIDDNKWHHIAFVVDALGMKLYIDGVLRASGNDFTPQEANTSCLNNSPLFIGSRIGLNHFKGEIDEVRLWTVGKTETEIQNEMFCKNPNTSNLQAAYNFNNGVPNGNNFLINQIQDNVGTNHGILNNFTKTGDVSNFVTGQVKYVKENGSVILDANNKGNEGSSWTSAIILQSALKFFNCNDLFDVYVATGTHRPHASDKNIFFDIPNGIKIFGGFAGTEKNINERNMELIHTTNKTTLSGDLGGNDTPFNFSTNRTDNTLRIVNIIGGNITLDGFTVRGGSEALYNDFSSEAKITNCKIIDNNFGLRFDGNSTVANCIMAGNNFDGVYIENNSANFQNCLIANNGRYGIYNLSFSSNSQVDIINCTIASNANVGIQNESGFEVLIANNIKNTIIKDNAGGGIVDVGGGETNNNISYSLVENQFVNTANPQFVSPLPNTVRSDAGDYHLKWCSLAINAGDNVGISPLDLDRNPRNFNTTADMGAYEFLGNTPSQVNNSTISGTIDSPIYAGGAIQTITSTAKVIAPAGAIDFKAPNSITLNPGFEARGVGKYFKAEIGANVGCVNP